MDRGGELCAVASARRRHRGEDRRDHRRPREGAVARRLSQLLVHRPRAGEALDQSSRQPRALQRRPPARRRHRLLPGDRPAPAARHHGALRRPHRRDVRPRAGPEARLLRPPGNRAGADQALPPDRRAQAASISPPTSSTSAAAQPHYFDLEARGARRGPGEPSGPRPTSTTSRTSRCASRTRSSATPSAPCTCTSAMADLAAELDDAGLKRACEMLWRDVTATQMYVTAGLGPAAANEGFTERLRPAQRHRLCRDLRLGRADLLGAAHAASRPRRQVRRRPGAGALQWRADRPVARRRRTTSTRIRSKATASTGAGTGTPARAAR